MLSVQNMMELQAKRGVKVSSYGSDVVQKTKEQAMRDCRRYIQERSGDYRGLDPIKKREKIRQTINEYIGAEMPVVVGYTDDEGRPDINKLQDFLIQEITDYGILTEAMRDPDVYEIRINGSEIKIEKKGKIYDLKDKDGNILSFTSTEQQDVVFRKLLGDTRIAPKYAVVNTSTVEGFRIAATHSSATSPDPQNPTAPAYHFAVIRKFKEDKMGLGEIVRFGTMSDNMARTLSLLPAGGIPWVTVGPTASGKTTTNNAILLSISSDLRTILLQNPSEIDLRFKDKSGRVYNDVVHFEAKDIENPSKFDPTMENLMAHILRFSPTFVCFGELRKPEEFMLGMQIMQAGHPVNSTYHASSTKGAISRYLTAYLAKAGNEPAHLALMSITSLMKICVVQKIMRDGSRKVLQISEIRGVREDNPNVPDYEDLYIFKIDKDAEYDEEGNLVAILGEHKRVGRISEDFINNLRIEGVRERNFSFLTKPVDPNEVETYTGEFELAGGKSKRD